MKLLILTQKIDKEDSVLGFFHEWVAEFAKHCEQVTVVCLEKGVYVLPDHVRVFSLGKEEGVSKIKYIFNFYKYILREQKNYDTVFVHMNPEYVVLGGFLWRVLGKKISLWYTHRQKNMWIVLAEKFTHHIFSASKEGLPVKSKKAYFLGHGINTGEYVCPQKKRARKTVNIASIGRITPIKNLDILIQAAALLKKKWNKKFRVFIIGSPAAPGDKEYLEKLQNEVAGQNLASIVTFSGEVAHPDMKEVYCSMDVTVNLAPTGGMDKVVLESIASGTPVMFSNNAFWEVLPEYGKDLHFLERDPGDLARRIMFLFEKDKEYIEDLEKYFLRVAKERLSHATLIEKIMTILSGGYVRN